MRNYGCIMAVKERLHSIRYTTQLPYRLMKIEKEIQKINKYGKGLFQHSIMAIKALRK